MKKHSSTRRGASTLVVAAVLVAVAVVGLAAVVFRTGGSGSEGSASQDEFVVKRGSFEISVPASGELAALKQIEIRNKLEYRAMITEIVDEGTIVKEGDVLFRLAKDEIEDKIQDAQDSVNAAKNSGSDQRSVCRLTP